MHELWLEAGGGTVMFDADRYVGLLRDHGWARERVGLIVILNTALARLRPSRDGIGKDLAPLLIDELGKQGWRIHDVVRCVRVGDPLTMGRPMSADEEAAIGIPQGPRANQEAMDPPPGAVASPSEAPREPGTGTSTFEHVTPEGDRFQVPDGWTPGDKSSRCRSCNALILWCTTPRGKRAPVQPNGESHFAGCPHADQWRKSA